MKICSQCKKEKSFDLFPIRSNRPSGHASMCKQCKKENYKITNEKSRQYSDKWKKENYERHKEIKRNWHKRNSEKINAARREKRALNPGPIRESEVIAKQKRRAMRTKNGHEPYTLKQMIDTYGLLCNICNKPIDLATPRKVGLPGWEIGLHIDHVVPISKGGPDTLDNVRPAHGLCNTRKGSSMLEW